MDERHLEIKVGALVVCAVAGLLMLLWLMGELSLSRGTPLAVELGHSGGVVKGAPVKLGGVTVGRVEGVTLSPDRRDEQGEPLLVKLDLSVEDRVFAALHADAQVAVTNQNIIGESFLELSPGSAKAPALAKGAVLRGVEAVRLDQVAQRMAGMLEQAGKVLEENPGALSALVTNVSGLTGTVNGVLTDNRAQIKTAAAELAETAKDLRQLAATARKAMEPGGKGTVLIDDAAATAKLLRQDLPKISENAGKTLGGLAAMTSQLNAEDGARLKQALASYTSAGQKLDQIAARGERLLARIEAGEGTLGGLQKDPQIYQDLKALIADLTARPWRVLWKQ
jgi:phospholipid/cholesterol/gamma-HCH transport system substrate-binding protein